MARETKVIDASVLVKWFVNEPHRDGALQLRSDHIAGKILLLVPELAFLEVLNTLRYKNHDAKALIEINKDLWEIQMHVERLGELLLEKSAELAIQYKLTLYDATYVALAQLSNSQLITADKALKNIPGVILLSENISLKK